MNNENKVLCIDAIAFFGILGYCFFASIYSSNFAEICINLPFLDFPIFISEQLLFVLVVLFAFKIFLVRKIESWIWVWVAYVGWILFSAFTGYKLGGAVALRNAALFYYAIFFLLGYSFYNPRIFSNQIVIRTIFLLGLCVATFKINGIYFWYSYVVLMMVIILRRFYLHRWWLIPAVFILAHFEILFIGSRAHMVGIIGAAVFVTIVSWAYLVRARWAVKSFIFIIVMIGFLFGLSRLGDHNAIKSVVDWKATAEEYARGKERIEKRKVWYKQYPMVSMAYHKNSSAGFDGQSRSSGQGMSSEEIVDRQWAAEATANKENNRSDSNVLVQEDTYNLKSQVSGGRDLSGARANILFRMFIWQDMWDEVYPYKLITGVGLGKPQRSPSLEILRWAESEWARDGWIMPHNSFFHMIYREGLVGLLVVLSLLGTLVYLTQVFIERKDVSGILLISVLVYWCLMAMFSVTLELPYYAILFWSLLGMTIAYSRK